MFETGFPDAQVFPDSEEEPLVSQQQRAGDDYTGDIVAPGTVAVGGSVTGVIGPPRPGFTGGDRDWFKVELEAGKTYRIDLEGASTSSGTLPDPSISGIYDAKGQKVPGTSTNNDGGEGRNARLLFAPDTGGTYYIAASSMIQTSIIQNSTGTYRLSVTEAEDFSTISSSAKTVEVGDVDNPPTGLIASDRERAWFAVELGAGVNYRIEMEGVDDALPGRALAKPAVFAVYDEGGNQVDHIFRFRGDKVAVLDIEPPIEGTYYIVLGRAAGSSSGRYRLSVTRTDDYPADIRTAGTVEVGGFATGEIETRRDVDWFKVTLDAGVEYEIGVLGSAVIDGALRDPYLVGIHVSGGDLIENTTDDNSGGGTNSGVLFVAPFGGNYYIAVRSADGGTGTYRVNVSRKIADDDYGADTSTTGTVAVGGFAPGRNENADDVDWFAVELLAGVEYRIDLRGSDTFAGTLGDPYLLGVWHGATRLEGSNDDDGGEGLDSRLSNFRPEADGTYYIAVSNSDPFTGGSYRLSVTATSVFGVVKHTATDIMVGGSAKGDIEQSGERDWFKIQLLAGVEYQIDIEGANFAETDTTDGTLRDPYLWGIYKPNGTKIPGTEKNDGGVGYNTRFVFEPEVNGTYYIATAGNAHYTGTYRLTVATVRSDDDDYSADIRTAGTVEVGGFATGEIETRRDVDWFKVTLEADTTYEFDVLGSAVIAGALRDPYLVGIHDSSGNLIENTTNNDYGGGTNSRVLFDASTGGIYYIAVRSADGGTGTYRVDVSRTMDDDYAADDSTTGTVAVGGFATGRIEADGDQDWFAVELMAGVDYRFDIRGSHTLAGTLPDPYLIGVWIDLRNVGAASGTSILAGFNDDDGGEGPDSRLSNFQPGFDGTYYIAVGSSDAFTGTYTVEVEEVM